MHSDYTADCNSLSRPEWDTRLMNRHQDSINETTDTYAYAYAHTKLKLSILVRTHIWVFEYSRIQLYTIMISSLEIHCRTSSITSRHVLYICFSRTCSSSYLHILDHTECDCDWCQQSCVGTGQSGETVSSTTRSWCCKKEVLCIVWNIRFHRSDMHIQTVTAYTV